MKVIGHPSSTDTPEEVSVGTTNFKRGEVSEGTANFKREEVAKEQRILKGNVLVKKKEVQTISRKTSRPFSRRQFSLMNSELLHDLRKM